MLENRGGYSSCLMYAIRLKMWLLLNSVGTITIVTIINFTAQSLNETEKDP